MGKTGATTEERGSRIPVGSAERGLLCTLSCLSTLPSRGNFFAIQAPKGEVPVHSIMFLGRVVGTVWATRKDEQLVGMKLQIVREVDLDQELRDRFVVAVDSVGAGVGEVVLVAQGSSARQTELTRDRPVDAVITAIVDKLDVRSVGELEALG